MRRGRAGLYRSDDAGGSWTRVSSDTRITSRNWYFSGITVDPVNADVVYAPNVAVYRSTDGGRTFTVLKGAPGGDDYRILWIDPTETRRMVLGSDQGTNVSLDGGQSWSSWYNQPTAQMYHVTTDNQFPYHVYGAQQDSGTAALPSRTNHQEIDARDFYTVSGGEAGYVAVDPKNHNIVYAGNTAGSLARFDKRTGEAHNISPSPGRGGFNPSTAKYRFPWTPPLVFSPTEPNTLYFGAQVLLKTLDGGITWQEISGDLTGDTRKDKTPVAGAVTTANAREAGYGVIYSIGPSPLRAGMVWVGSDTGLIHLTRDGGKTWQNVTPGGLPAWSKVSMIEASHFDAGEAWAAIDRHRLEDYKPYIYRTRDYGRTWTLVADGLAAPAFVNSVKEDPARRGLLYAGTELGANVSFDSGDHWQTLQLNLPAVSVRDLVVHGNDLVIATHGRGFWILDDITPLRQADEKIAASEATLYRPASRGAIESRGIFGNAAATGGAAGEESAGWRNSGLLLQGGAGRGGEVGDSGREGRCGAAVFERRSGSGCAAAGGRRRHLVLRPATLDGARGDEPVGVGPTVSGAGSGRSGIGIGAADFRTDGVAGDLHCATYRRGEELHPAT